MEGVSASESPEIMSTLGGLSFLSLHPFVRATVADKLRGVILGAALGDCIGLYTEFLSKELSWEAYPLAKFQLVEPTTTLKIDGHRNKFSKKSWTDDTDHALLIILSYLNHDGELLSDDLAKRLRIWAEQGLRCLDRPPLGLGRTVGRVVFDKAYVENPRMAAYNYWVSSSFNAAPNGSLMRTHPLGVMCVGKSREDTFRIATEFSVVTHADPRCVLACCISTALIRDILRGEIQAENDVDAIIDVAFEWVNSWQKRGRNFEEDAIVATDDEWVDASMKREEGEDEKGRMPANTSSRREEPSLQPEPSLDRLELYKHVRAKDIQELQLDDSMRMGYVYKSLGVAIVSLRRAIHGDRRDSSNRKMVCFSRDMFENLITEIVMEGGDADTNASIAGAILGAWLGYTALPAHWRDGIEHRDWLLRKCKALSCTMGIESGSAGYKGSEDADTMEDGGKGFLDRVALEAREMAFMERYLKKRADTGAAETKHRGWRAKLFS